MNFKDPPPPKTHQPYIEKDIETLKKRPNEWAFIKNSKSQGVAHPFKAKGCKTTTRKQPDGTFDLYAMWVVDDDAIPPAS